MRLGRRNALACILALVISYNPFNNIAEDFHEIRESIGGQLYWPRLRILEEDRLRRMDFCLEAESLKTRDFYLLYV